LHIDIHRDARMTACASCATHPDLIYDDAVSREVVLKLHRSTCCTIHRKRAQFRFRLRPSTIVRNLVASGFGAIAGMLYSRRDDARKAEVVPPAA
jgi:hypothetical protein